MESNLEARVTEIVATDNQPAGSEAEAAPTANPPAALTEAESVHYANLVTRFKKLEDHWVESTAILAEIRDNRLYRGQYDNFADFCRKELSMSRANVDRQCQTMAIAQLLTTNVGKPTKESHVRPLLQLKTPDHQIEAFRKAMGQARKKPLTGLMIQRAVSDIIKADPLAARRQPVEKPLLNEMIAKIGRKVICDLEDLTMEQLDEFQIAVIAFKDSWIKSHPAVHEPTTRENGGQS